MPSKGIPPAEESSGSSGVTSRTDDQKTSVSGADGRQRNHSGNRPSLNREASMDIPEGEPIPDKKYEAWNRQNTKRDKQLMQEGQDGGEELSRVMAEEAVQHLAMRTQGNVYDSVEEENPEEPNNNVNSTVAPSEPSARKLSTSQTLETIPENGSDEVERYDARYSIDTVSSSEDNSGNKTCERSGGQVHTPIKRKLYPDGEDSRAQKKGNNKKGVKFDDKTTELVIIPSDHDSDRDSIDSRASDRQDSTTHPAVVKTAACKPGQQNTLKKKKKKKKKSGDKRTSGEGDADDDDDGDDIVWVRQDSLPKLEEEDVSAELKETQLGKNGNVKKDNSKPEEITLKDKQLGKEEVVSVVSTTASEVSSRTESLLQGGQLADGAAVQIVVANGKKPQHQAPVINKKKDESAIRDQLVEINVDLLCEGYLQPCSSLMDTQCNSEEQRLLGDHHPLPEALEDVSTTMYLCFDCEGIGVLSRCLQVCPCYHQNRLLVLAGSSFLNRCGQIGDFSPQEIQHNTFIARTKHTVHMCCNS